MEQMNIRIDSIRSEKRPDGFTEIRATNLEDSSVVSITIPNSKNKDREYITNELKNSFLCSKKLDIE